ncbi:MAG: glycosyltransferase family 39 protein [Acidobacteriota bacterium]|nr:glycosyltransferase family 39 protein [Acidobacteriota bacterium]
MEHTSTASTKLALALTAALFALSVFRAATADITPGEAWNYTHYILPPWHDALLHYDTNNHVLNTLLARVSTAALGRKEIALRLPSLLAGLLYGWAAWRLSRRLYSGWGFPAAWALLLLNPLVVDALSEARGYGMAIAFWCWGLELFLQSTEELTPRKLNLAAAALALSVAGCLSFVVPVLALGFAATAILRRRMFRDFWLPLAVFLFLLLAIPLNRVLLTDLAVGATSLRQTLGELTAVSLAALPFPAATVAAAVRVSAALLVLAAGAFAVVRRRSEPMLTFCAATTLIGFGLLLLAHARLKAPFPLEGAIYFVPVLTLTALALMRRLPRTMLCLAAGCLVIYAVELPRGDYREGRQFAGSRDIAKALRTGAGRNLVRIAVSPPLEEVLDYYRARYRQANWQTIETTPAAPGYDFYVLTGEDAPVVERLNLRVLDRTAGVLLAAPKAR